ncbi:MAG: pilus assembly protein [Alphaproteobacteria bacterium]|nr:pilus assembly protein [Alphaproteobacteria bacterium]
MSKLRERLARRARSGSALLEFALLAPVFFLMLFAIMEVGIIFFAQSTLQTGAEDAARLVRTGQVQNGGLTADQVRTRVCKDIAPLIPCDGNLYIDIESFSNFGGVNFSNPLGPDNKMKPMNNFSTGNACDVILVRVFYTWTVFTPILTPFLVNLADNKHLLYASSAFRNEPFSQGMSGC